jgi:drug/metabolite transporter (DMT)-like permease
MLATRDVAGELLNADDAMTDPSEHRKQMMAKREAGRSFGPGFLAGLLIGGGVYFLTPGAPAAVVLTTLPFVTAGLAYNWRLKRLIRNARHCGPR